jgi:hypothetical protein
MNILFRDLPCAGKGNIRRVFNGYFRIYVSHGFLLLLIYRFYTATTRKKRLNPVGSKKGCPFGQPSHLRYALLSLIRIRVHAAHGEHSVFILLYPIFYF